MHIPAFLESNEMPLSRSCSPSFSSQDGGGGLRIKDISERARGRAALVRDSKWMFQSRSSINSFRCTSAYLALASPMLSLEQQWQLEKTWGGKFKREEASPRLQRLLSLTTSRVGKTSSCTLLPSGMAS